MRERARNQKGLRHSARPLPPLRVRTRVLSTSLSWGNFAVNRELARTVGQVMRSVFAVEITEEDRSLMVGDVVRLRNSVWRDRTTLPHGNGHCPLTRLGSSDELVMPMQGVA